MDSKNLNTYQQDNINFQTPIWACDLICYLLRDICFSEEVEIDGEVPNILEPTSGAGNLVNRLQRHFDPINIITPKDFFTDVDKNIEYDAIVGNPPFTPMSLSYKILDECMNLNTERIVMIMPWLTLINSEKRMKKIDEWGLSAIYHLPRKTFRGSRIQCCILNMHKQKYFQEKKLNNQYRDANTKFIAVDDEIIKKFSENKFVRYIK